MRSAAALSQANNDLDKSIALVVAANDVVQNPETVGTALRTVALRVRAAKKSLEELGEDTDGLADSVSSLREEVLALSGVDIMENENQFKDTYDILRELAYVWKDLSDVSQAALLEKLGGKRGANVIASILTNVHDLEAAYASAQNAAGSAAAENAKYLESIEGKISQLSATWQEFWDNSHLQEITKSVVDLFNKFLSGLNKLGGLKSLGTFAGVTALGMNINNISNAVDKLLGTKTKLIDFFRTVNSQVSSNGIGWTGLAKNAFLGKNVSYSAENVVSNAMSGIIKDFNSEYAKLGSQLNVNKLVTDSLRRSQIELADSTKGVIVAGLKERAMHEGNANATNMQAVQTAALKNELKEGTTQTYALATAQKALQVAMMAGIALAISVVIKLFRDYKETQEKIRQEAIGTGKASTEQAYKLREVTKEFFKIREQYKNHAADSDKLREAAERVNEVLGDQAAILKDLDPASDAYAEALQKLTNAQNNVAFRDANAALGKASESQFTDKQKSKIDKASLITGVGSALATAAVWGKIGATIGTAIGGPIGTAIGGAGSAVAGTVVGLITAGATKAVGTLLNKPNSTIKHHLEEYAKLYNELDSLNRDYDRLVEDRLNAEAANNMSMAEVFDKKIKDNIEAQEKLRQGMAEYQELVSEYLTAAVNLLGESDAFRKIERTVDYYRAAGEEIEKVSKGSEEIAKLIRKQLGSDSRFSAFEAIISSAEDAEKSLNITNVTVEDLLDTFEDADIVLLASSAVREFAQENNYAAKSIEDLRVLLRDYKDDVKQTERESNTLTKAIKNNKDAIDGFQESLSKLTSIMKNDYSGNASGLLDDLQEYVDILTGMDKAFSEDWINRLNDSFSLDELVKAMKEGAEAAADFKLDALIDSLNLANPVLETLLKNLVEQEKGIEAVTSDLDAFKDGYSSLVGIINDYNKTGMLTVSNLSALLKMDSQYLALLKEENGALTLNKEALNSLLQNKIEEAKIQAITSAQAKIEAIYRSAEARVTREAAEATTDFAISQLNAKAATDEATDAIINSITALEAYKTTLGMAQSSSILNADELAAIEGVNIALEKELETLDMLSETVASGSLEFADAFFEVGESVEDTVDDAQQKIKSAIDSTLSYYKAALDSGAISWKQYIEKMIRILDEYGDQLSLEDRLNLQKDIAQAKIDALNAAKDAAERYIDRKFIKPIEDSVEALNRQKEAFEENKEAIEKYYDSIIKELEDQKNAIEKQSKALQRQKRDYEDQIKVLEKSKRPYEQQQKAIDKQVKAIEKQVKALEKTKKPLEDQQETLDKQSKAIEKQIKALEKTKKPYEDQQKAIDKEIKGIEKQIKAIQATEKPYQDEQKAIQKSITVIEDKIYAMEQLQKPYRDQLRAINNEIAALEREITLLERTKVPYQRRQQDIQDQIDAIEYQISVMERAETAYKREQDALNKEIELIERQVSALEQRKRPYEIAQREIEKQIYLLQRQQKELEKLKEPYQDEIDALQKEKEAMEKANEERQEALSLQQAEYNLRRAQQQRPNLVYQDGQFQYVADQKAIKEAQKNIDELNYKKSIKTIEDAIDDLQAKIDDIVAQSDEIQDAIDELTDKNEELAYSIQLIQYEIDPLQDEIDDLSYHVEQLQWSINDVEYSLTDLKYSVEDLGTISADISESIRLIDETLRPFNESLEDLTAVTEDLQWEIDLIQQSIDPLNDDIDELNRRSQLLQRIIDEIEESIEPLNEQIEELNEKNEQLQEYIDAIEESIEPLNDQLDELSERSEQIQDAIDAIDESIQPLQDSIEELNEQSEEIQESIDAIDESIDDLRTNYIEPLDDAIEELSRQSEELSDSIDELREKQEEETEIIDLEIAKIEEEIAAKEKQIQVWQDYKQAFQDTIDAIQNVDDEALLESMGWIDKINEMDPSVPQDFANQYWAATEDLRNANLELIQNFGEVSDNIENTTNKNEELKQSLANAQEAKGPNSIMVALDDTGVEALKASGVFAETKLSADDLKLALNSSESMDTDERKGLKTLLLETADAAKKVQDEIDGIIDAIGRLWEQRGTLLEIAGLFDVYLIQPANRAKDAIDPGITDAVGNLWDVVRVDSHLIGDALENNILKELQEIEDFLKKDLPLASHYAREQILEDINEVVRHVERYAKPEIISSAQETVNESIDYLEGPNGKGRIINVTDDIINAINEEIRKFIYDDLPSHLGEIERIIRESVSRIVEAVSEISSVFYDIENSVRNAAEAMNSFSNSTWQAGEAAGNLREIFWNIEGSIKETSKTLDEVVRKLQEMPPIPSYTTSNESNNNNGKVDENDVRFATEYKGEKRISSVNYHVGSGKAKAEKWRREGYDVVITNGREEVGRLLRYAQGGRVPAYSNQDAFTRIARSIGEDRMVAVQNGERILTPTQNRDFEEFVRLTPELISASESLAKYAKLFNDISTMDSMASESGIMRGVNGVVNRENGVPVTNNTMSLNIGDIHVHEVKDADDLARQIKNNLPNSLIQALGRAS